jgi:sarcosine oxidase subunit alpha
MIAPRFYPKAGIKTWGIPIQVRRTIVEVLGTEEVEGVHLSAVDVKGRRRGQVERVDVDCVCIAGGLYPMSELASGAGCKMVFVEELGGEVPVYGADLQTTERGLYVAGNIAGVEGAKVALAYGRLAGHHIADAHGQLDDPAFVVRAHEFVLMERARAPISFHPEVAKGRVKMEAFANRRSLPQS